MDNWVDRNIIFLISLPRSGSTLAQRVLGAHPKIQTLSESWVLLHHLSGLAIDEIYASYDHMTSVRAVKEFISQLDGGLETYRKELTKFFISLFRNTADCNTKYFLEKTPRNNLVIEEIFLMFPNSKFIFLWRNPLSVIASFIATFGNGKWKLPYYKIDIFQALTNMINSYERYRDKVCSVKYEDLSIDPQSTFKNVFDYLDISFDPRLLNEFSNFRLTGSLGDSMGAKKFQKISTEPLNKWKQFINNPLRQQWCRRYLEWIGKDRLAIMGYDMQSLMIELKQQPTTFKNLGSDSFRMAYGILDNIFEFKIIGEKINKLPNWHNIKVHR